MTDLKTTKEFDWNNGNKAKNWIKHNVSIDECETGFFDKDLLSKFDEKHSSKEKRYQILCKTRNERYLFIVFTIRRSKIRVISARDMNKSEIRIYNNK